VGGVTTCVATSLGPVEVDLRPGAGDVVLFFPGGHTTAATPLGPEVYTELGYRTLTFSRPGYGRTDVGPLTAASFVPVVAEVCEQLGISSAVATVGLSFGGLQALQVAVGLPDLAPRLILHSCAPSSLPYPDTRWERAGAALAFGPRSQRLTWPLVRALTSTTWGLRAMMGRLSTAPVEEWWAQWTDDDRAAARATFAHMDSGSGFLLDVRQASAAGTDHRRSLLRSVPCPTLVTASRLDGGVAFAHAEDFARVIPDCRLAETGAPSHFAWLGPSRQSLQETVRSFLAG
jgi:pimeloyl-ACP methyl ester carboxylesterase